jgi:hypothetical protein
MMVTDTFWGVFSLARLRRVIMSFFHFDDDDDDDDSDNVLSVLILTSNITDLWLLLFFCVSGFLMPCTHPMANKLPSQTWLTSKKRNCLADKTLRVMNERRQGDTCKYLLLTKTFSFVIHVIIGSCIDSWCCPFFASGGFLVSNGMAWVM